MSSQDGVEESPIDFREQFKKETDKFHSELTSYLSLQAGQPAISGGYIQIIYGIYFGVISFALMHTADSTPGGVRGVSVWLAIIAVGIGWIYCYIAANHGSSIGSRIIFSATSAVLFLIVIWFGLKTPLFSFQYQPPGELPPFYVGTAIYALANSIVFLRLQRRVSPDKTGETPSKDKIQIHFDNSWRMFQAMISIAAALGVGFLFPLAGIFVRRQGLVLEPLTWYAVGLFFGSFVLATQLLYEMHFLEEEYTNAQN